MTIMLNHHGDFKSIALIGLPLHLDDGGAVRLDKCIDAHLKLRRRFSEDGRPEEEGRERQCTRGEIGESMGTVLLIVFPRSDPISPALT